MESASNLNPGVDGHGLWLLDGHACQHELSHFAIAKNPIHFGQFHARVDAQQLGRIFDLHGNHAMAGAIQDLDDVGQIIFMRWVVGFDIEQMPPQQISLKTIDPGVDVRDRALFGRGVFMLHDRLHLALFPKNNSAVAGGIVEFRGDHSSGGVFRKSGGGSTQLSVAGASSGQSP